MTIRLTMTNGDTYRVPHVEAIRLVGKTTVEIKTFGNEPALNRQIRTFEVFYDSDADLQEGGAR